ncbi:hypothetical protein OS493_025773 [Desmophyllum pertusum]|uniref:Uncharacterized protein n=1 Tax=Desmophyllum pertusum TaxID=174260 RepID=A0A9X0CY98_9CNID|nr:hypothetical protein OS493_025773 [Desmophyllum pertusum]
MVVPQLISWTLGEGYRKRVCFQAFNIVTKDPRVKSILVIYWRSVGRHKCGNGQTYFTESGMPLNPGR